jgi:Fur family ferric uptake transcriptional regulator
MQLTPEASLDLACARLRKAQMRITQPRVAIISVLAKLSTPVSIEDLHARLETRSCDLVTVYRCLAAFEEVGLVRRTFHYTGTCLYELVLSGRPDRYHVICRVCNAVESLDAFPVDAAAIILQQRGYTQLNHVVEFFGTCPACRKKGGGRLEQF